MTFNFVKTDMKNKNMEKPFLKTASHKRKVKKTTSLIIIVPS